MKASTRVRRNQEDGAAVVFHELGDGLAPDRRVLVGQVQPRFSWLLVGGPSKHHKRCLGAVREVAGSDFGWMGEGNGMVEVHDFALGFGSLHVDENDFRN